MIAGFKQKTIFAFTVISVCIAGTLYANSNRINDADRVIRNADMLASGKFQFEKNKKSLWTKYLKDTQGLLDLKSEYDDRALHFQDKTMRFSLEKRGDAPKDGYPLYIALHGGGQASPWVNDSQWEDMKTYYRDSVTSGIYVATRGITDNWKLHFEDESYPLYEKLIESAILFDNVNPNRVYLLGFSAGGDGVYQVIPRMPARFAAANMSAGHHNWITFDNLYNTPFMMQVGERDGAFDRNHVAAKNYVTMNNLNTKYHGGYIHDVYIHYNGSHNSWHDNDATRKDQSIMANPIAWLENESEETKSVNTNAIDWLNQYSRNAVPEKLVWDLAIDANKRIYQTGAALLGKNGYEVKKLAQPHDLFYWLDVSVADSYPDHGKLVVEVDKSSNTIQVSEASNIDKFRILLNPSLLNLSVPVKVKVGDQLISTVSVNEWLSIMTRTMLERSDVNEIYDAEITLSFNKDTQRWEIGNA